MTLASARERIRAAIAGWPGVTVARQRCGRIEFRYGRRELGRLHGDERLDLLFPGPVRDELLAGGEAGIDLRPADGGRVSLRLREPGDLERAVALLRRSYELVVVRRRSRSPTAAAIAAGESVE